MNNARHVSSLCFIVEGISKDTLNIGGFTVQVAISQSTRTQVPRNNGCMYTSQSSRKYFWEGLGLLYSWYVTSNIILCHIRHLYHQPGDTAWKKGELGRKWRLVMQVIQKIVA